MKKREKGENLDVLSTKGFWGGNFTIGEVAIWQSVRVRWLILTSKTKKRSKTIKQFVGVFLQPENLFDKTSFQLEKLSSGLDNPVEWKQKIILLLKKNTKYFVRNKK